MKIFFDAPPGFDSKYLIEELRRNEYEISTNMDACDRLVLIHSNEDQESLYDRLEELKGLSEQLVIWVMKRRTLDRRGLTGKRVNRILEPLGWSTVQVAERLLAELFADRPQEQSSFGAMRGATLVMRELYKRITKVANFEDPALILGETGTGKGMVAIEVHRCSGRPGEWPFKINSAACPPEHLESELFGHVKGAYTGAAYKRKGLILTAGEASFFLDEIGELSSTAQAKLLAVIEDRQVRPLGSDHFVPISARLIFATHKELSKEVSAGNFRQDLYQRLRVFMLRLPPLRERRADIILLANVFLKEFNDKHHRNLTLSDLAKDALFSHDWPGNVRELANVILAASGFSEGNTLSNTVLLETLRGDPRADVDLQIDPMGSWDEVQGRLKSTYFRNLVWVTGTKKEAQAISGLSKARFYEILKELGLSKH